MREPATCNPPKVRATHSEGGLPSAEPHITNTELPTSLIRLQLEIAISGLHVMLR